MPVGVMFAFSISFMLQRGWVFRSTKALGPSLFRFALTCVVSGVFAVLLSAISLALYPDVVLASILAGLTVFISIFFGSNAWAFNSEGEENLNPSSYVIHSKFALTYVAILFIASLTLLVWVLRISSSFRPIQDDYVFAAWAYDVGPIRASIDYFLQANSGITQSLYSFSVGWSVGGLPDSIAYTPFVLGYFLLIGFTSWKLWSFVRQNWCWQARIGASGFSALVWVGAVGGIFDNNRLVDLLAQLSYFAGSSRGPFFLAIILLATYVAQNLSLFPPRFRFAAIPLGLVIGLWNLSESMAVGVITIASAILISRDPRLRELKLQMVLVGAAALVGVFINWASPGTQSRAANLGSAPALDTAVNTLAIFNNAWGITLGNPAVWLGFVGLVSFSVILLLVRKTHAKLQFDRSPTPFSAGPLVAYFVALMGAEYVLLSVGAARSYFGIWQTYGLPSLFLAAGIVASAKIAEAIGRRDFTPLAKTSIIGIAIVATLVCIGSSYLNAYRLSKLAETRSVVWDSGDDAPVGYLVDKQIDWIQKGYEYYERVRGQTGKAE